MHCKRGYFQVLREMERLIQEVPNEKVFKAELARFTSFIKAARRFHLSGIGSGVDGSLDDGRSIFWLSNARGEEVMMGTCADHPGPQRIFRCVPGSPIARCASELWGTRTGQFWRPIYFALLCADS
jgi:hypothetical protein